MATLDGSDEPLFADDLDDYSDDEPPPLPPPIVPRRQKSPLIPDTRRVDSGLRIGAGPLPPPANSAGAGNNRQKKRNRERNNSGEVGDTNDNEDTPPKKVRKPVLTLKMDRLFADNGFPYLVREFPKLKFKGRNEEVRDLKLLLQQYEEWANNLYPKFTFHDFCKRIEAMSKKTEFRSQLNIIRSRSVGLDEERMEKGVESLDGIVVERLSPELEDPDPVPDPSNENESLEVDNSNTMTTDLEHVSQTSVNGSIISDPAPDPPEIFPDPADVVQEPPNPWNIIPEEDDGDPYEDFPDL